MWNLRRRTQCGVWDDAVTSQSCRWHRASCELSATSHWLLVHDHPPAVDHTYQQQTKSAKSPLPPNEQRWAYDLQLSASFQRPSVPTTHCVNVNHNQVAKVMVPNHSHHVFLLSACMCLQCLTPLVWHQQEHSACKNWVIRCWCAHLTGARCRLFAYGPADATAIPKPHHLLSRLNPDWFYLSGTGLPRLSWKRGS